MARRDLSAVDNLLAKIGRTIAWIEELSAGTRGIRGELERVATMEDDRSPLTFAEFMEVLNEVRRIERTVLYPAMGMVERDLDGVRRYLAASTGRGDGCDGDSVVGDVAVANALANRLELSRL